MGNQRTASLHKIFFYALIVFLPNQLGLHFWPLWAHVLGRRVDYLSPTIYFTDVLLVFTFMSWIIERYTHRQVRLSKEVKKIWANKQKMLLIIASMVFILVNILMAAAPWEAVYKWIKVAEFFLLGWYVVRTRPNSDYVVTAFLWAASWVSIIVILQVLRQGSVGGALWFLGERTFRLDTPGIARFDTCDPTVAWLLPRLGIRCQEILRAYGTFPHPNVLAGFLTAVLPLAVWRLFTRLKNDRQIARFLLLLSVAVMTVAFVLTVSRSAIVLGVLVLLWLFGQKGMPKHIRLVNILFIMGIGVFVFALVFFIGTSPMGTESIVVRQQLAEAAMIVFARAPWVGVGLGNFLVALPSVLPSRTVYFLQPVHSIFLLTAVELGVIGVIGFLWIIGKPVLSLGRYLLFLTHKPIGMPGMLYVSLVILLLLGTVDHYLLTLQQGQLLFTLFLSFGYGYPLLGSRSVA